MANDQAPRGASRSGMSVLLMALAILLIAGLMGWLAMQERERGATVVAEEEVSPADMEGEGPPAEAVSDTVFEQNLRSYRGRDIQVSRVRFSANLSPQVFWVELPTGQPFLVKLDSAMVARGATPPTGGDLTIVGAVREKTPALLTQWLQTGVLQGENQRAEAEFGSTYIEARQVRPAR